LVAAEDGHVDVIGRGPELGSIAGFLDAVPAGPSALVIQGEAGIGKTVLWNGAVAAARDRNYTVMSCHPAQAESKLPYLGLGDLFTHVPGQVLAELPVPQRRALEVALLRTEGEGDPLQQRAVSAAVVNSLLILARSAPVLVAVDDVQWLDSPSRRVLRFAIRRIAPASVGILVAIRSGGSDEDPLDLGGVLPAKRLSRLTVGPLSLQAVERLLRSRLHAAFPGPALRRLEQTSGGNPYFALELGKLLLDPEVSAFAGQPLPAPSSLTGLLRGRLGRLPRASREALLIVSALSRPTADLVRAASATPEAAADAMERAATAGLIKLRDGSVRFTHPLLASVVYSQASGAELRRLHQHLAGQVVDPEERARHLALGADGPDGAVAAAIDAAATSAARRGAPDAAAALLEQATRLTPRAAPGDVRRRKLDAADQHVAAGDTARARLLLEQVEATSDAGTTRARVLHRLSRVRGFDSGLSAAPPLLEQALEEVGDDLPLRVAIERDLVFALIQVGAPSDALPHARAGLLAAEASGQPILLAEALDYLCMAELLVGNRVSTKLLDRAISVDQQVGPAPLLEHPGMATGRFPLALTLKWTDRFDDARDLLRSLYTEHGEHGDEGSLLPVLFHLGELEFWAGNWETATRLAEECHELASRTGQAVADRRAFMLEAMVETCRGNVAVARSKGQASLVLSENAADSLAVIRSLKSLGLLELSLGHPGEAVGYLERGLELEAEAGYNPGVLRLVPDAVEALLAAGRPQAARPLVEALEANGRRLGRPWALATGARARGQLEATAGDLARAQSALEGALREHKGLPQPFELARTLLAMGTIRRRAKQKREARESLGQALAIFRELGAALWADRTRAELGRIGGRAPTAAHLTPTEERVAELVAEGQTNREVAGSLFMSVKTVEANLTHIYRKVGVSSRRQLARWLRAEMDRRQHELSSKDRDSP
jgi:DNA-binding CsgD family transcriptional regulator